MFRGWRSGDFIQGFVVFGAFGALGAVGIASVLDYKIIHEDDLAAAQRPQATVEQLADTATSSMVQIANLECSSDTVELPIIVSSRYGTRGPYESIRAADPNAVIGESMSPVRTEEFFRATITPDFPEIDTLAEFNDLPYSISHINLPVTCSNNDTRWNLR